MPTKHISDTTWRKVEKETVKAVTQTLSPIKDTEILDLLIQKGIEGITEDDYKKFAEIKKK